MLCEKVPQSGKFSIAYARVSTERQAEYGYGLDIQREKLSAYCKLHDIKNAVYFEDDGYSGTNMDRPAMQRAIELIRQKRVERFIVYRFDRLSRSLRDMIIFIDDELKANGCDIVSLSEDIDTGNPMGKAMMQITAVFAELDRNNIVTKTKLGMQKRVESGKWPGGGIVPFGYQYDSKSNTLVVIDEQAEKVREVFSRYLSGESPAVIAQSLGFRSERIVSQMLKRKSLTGVIEYNGRIYNGLHQPIIDAELFEKTQREIEKRSVFKGKGNYLLSGLLYCGDCGARMRYQKWGNSGYKLVCYSQQPSSKPYLIKNPDCENDRFDAREIEEAVIKKLFEFSYENQKSNTKNSDIEAVRREAEKKLNREKTALRKLLQHFKYDCDDEVIKEEIEKSRQNIKTIEKSIITEMENRKTAEKIAAARTLLKTIPDTWEYMSSAERQLIIREIVEKVVLSNSTCNIHFKLENYFGI